MKNLLWLSIALVFAAEENIYEQKWSQTFKDYDVDEGVICHPVIVPKQKLTKEEASAKAVITAWTDQATSAFGIRPHTCKWPYASTQDGCGLYSIRTVFGAGTKTYFKATLGSIARICTFGTLPSPGHPITFTVELTIGPRPKSGIGGSQ